MIIGVVIPTRRERPDFLKFSLMQLDRQSLQPDHIYIVDEAPKSNKPDIHYRYKKGYDALKHTCDLIVFWEEDDYYPPDYLEKLSQYWKGEPLIGFNKSLYYNILTQRYEYIDTPKHSSMFCTAMAGGLEFPAGDEKFVDILLWKTFKGRLLSVLSGAVGIKHGSGLIVSRGHKMPLKSEDIAFRHLSQLVDVQSLQFYLNTRKVIMKIKPLHIAVVTGIWKRPEVFELFAQGVKNLFHLTEAHFSVIVAGSEGITSRRAVERHGFHYIETPNKPLADKMNQTTLAAGELNVDYTLCLGSDDIISPELMQVYLQYMQQGYDFIGVTDFYFFDLVSRKAAYWGGYRELYRKNVTCGAGRVISNRLMRLWKWKVWETRHNNILDDSIDCKLRNTQHSAQIFSLRKKGVLGLDIKSATNMTPFQLWDNTQYIDTLIIQKYFPYVWNSINH